MSNQYLKLRRSGVPGKIPTTESIDFGEIALNTYDGLAFMKKSGSNGEEVVRIGSPSGSFTGNFTGTFTGSLQGTASWANNATTASYVQLAQTASYVQLAQTASYVQNAQSASYVLNAISASYAATASLAPAYLPLTGGTINGNVTVNGTASVAFLHTVYVSSSVIYSSGSNQFGDATNDTQTLIGTVIVSGSQQITGSLYAPTIIGSLYGTASWANNAQTASNILGGKVPHVPYFITDTTLATSSIYQSGSTSVIINQDANTTANPEALYVWQPHPTSINVISGKGDIDNYLQLNIQNTNQGDDASSDVVATANNGNESINYIDMGINSENFAGFLGGPNDAYLYSTGENLLIGNYSDGKSVYFFNSSSEAPLITLTPSNTVSVPVPLTAPNISGSLHGTASWAINAVSSSYASNATNAFQASTASYVQQAETAISASHALNADFATYAANAGIAANGGVTQLIAGSGISLLPSTGLGAVTIVAGGGAGGVTIISGSNVTQSFNNLSTWVFNHDLGVRTPVIQAFDANYNQLIPQSITLLNTTSSIITFPVNKSGFAIASIGGVSPTTISASYALQSTYADTASFAFETDPVFVARSGSLATTGSNVFRGNQTITGSLNVTGGITGSLLGTASFATTASFAVSSSFALTASFVQNAQSASYVLQAVSSSFASTASYVVTSSYSLYSETAGTSQNASDIVLTVLNQTGAQINKGIVVRITGSDNSSDIPRVGIADWTNDNLSANTLGLALTNIPNGSTGSVMTEGLFRGYDTSTPGWSTGQVLYLGASGSITGSAPTAPLHGVRLGQVIRVQSNNGSIYLRIDNGYEIGELHDIIDNTTTSSFGDLLVKSGSVWINSKQLSGSYAITGSLTISGSGTFTNIGPANFTGSLNITGSTTQTGNNTLIGNTTLSGSINVSGSQTFNGVSAFYGNHTLSGSNTIVGNTIMSGSIRVSGSSNFNNSEFIVTGSTSILGNFNVKGTSVFSDTTFTVTGSQYFTGSSFINGNQSLTGNSTVTGSLNVLGNINVISGSSFTRWGNKLFNYGQFINTASIAATANVSASFVFPVTSFKEGISIVSGSRVTFENTGLYNLEFTAIANQGTGIRNLHIWFRKTGSNIEYSDTLVQLQNNTQTLLAWNFAFPFSASEYVEMWYHTDGANTSFPYAAAGSGFPASPSIRLTITQVA